MQPLPHLSSSALGRFTGSYLAHVRLSKKGGEGEIDLQPGYCILWPVEAVFINGSDYQVTDYAPGFLAFGSNGGGELFAFDMREPGKAPVVILPGIGSLP